MFKGDFLVPEVKNSSSTNIPLNKSRYDELKRIDEKIPNKEKLFIIVSSLLLGSLFDKFFTNGNFGVSVPIYALLLTGIFLYSIKENIKTIKSTGFIMLTAALLLSTNFAVHSNVFFTMLNILIIPFLFTASYILIRYQDLEWSNIRFLFPIFDRIIVQSMENSTKLVVFARGFIKKKDKTKLNPAHKSILTGLLISVPMLLIIIPLLASADSMFGYYITNFYTLLPSISIQKFIFDILLVIIVSLYIFGFLWSYKYSISSALPSKKSKEFFEPVTVLTLMGVINTVYLIFTLIQFSYLYGGGTLPIGFTYAEYARRGFFELVLITVINFTLLALCNKYSKKQNSALNKALKTTYTVLVLFTFNMLFSAHFKMSLYESAFGYTHLRIFVHFFLLLLFMLYIVALAGIWNNKVPVNKLSISIALTMYVFINFANVDTIIAEKNIERYQKTKSIDIVYLTSLSYDVVPILKEFASETREDIYIQAQLNDYFSYTKDRLSRKSSWFEFNYSKYRAREVLNR